MFSTARQRNPKLSCRNAVGIFGGTFDPFHLGHLEALKHFEEKFDFEKILVVPNGIPPHKMQKSDVSAEDRLEMVRRGIQEIKTAEAWDFEIRSGGKSYSYRTIEEAAKNWPGKELIFFTGSDMFLSLHTWKYPERIFSLAKIAVFSRTGTDFNDLNRQKKFLRKTYRATCFLFEEKPIAVSSTEIREQLRNKKSFEYLPAAVAEYIKEKGLYPPRNYDGRNHPVY